MNRKLTLGIGLLVCAMFIFGTSAHFIPQANAQTESVDPSTHKDKDDDKGCECDGKISTLTLRYNGDGSPTIKVEQKKEGTIFEETVVSESQFTIQGIDGEGTLGTQISIYIDDTLSTQIHTSCSVKINIGQTFGNFTVTNGQSRNNGKLCVIGSGGGNENSNSNTNEGNENDNENENENENGNGNGNTNDENEPGTDIPEVSYPALFGIAGGSMIIGLLVGLMLKSKGPEINEAQKTSNNENKENSQE